MAEIAAVVERLEGTEVSSCGRDDLDAFVRDLQLVRGWIDAQEVQATKRNRELTGAGREGNTNLLSNRGRRSTREARDAAERAETCEQIPQLGDALEHGECSAGHVDAVTRATANLDDKAKERVAACGDAIAAAAKDKTPEQLGREVRDLARNCTDDDGLSHNERLRRQRRVRRWVNRETGMSMTTLELDPETDAKVGAALRSAVRRWRAGAQDDGLTFDQLQADAFVDLIVNGEAGALPGRPEITVLLDWQTLVDGLHDRSVCETGDGVALPVGTMRRLCCDADIVPVVLNGDGVVVDEGRAQRTATREQRRALRAMYRHCAFAGCEVGFDQCRIHHVRYWWNHGPTDLANLIPLCERHHHAVHEGGYTLELFDHRRMRIATPNGHVLYDGPCVTRTPTDTIERAPTPPAPDSVEGAAGADGPAPELGDDVPELFEDQLALLRDAELVEATAALLDDHHVAPGEGLTVAVARGYLESQPGSGLPDDVTAKLREIHHRHRQQRHRTRRTEPARPAPPELVSL